MRVIYKYEHPLTDNFSIEMNPGTILHAQAKSGFVTMWVQVETDAPTHERHFTILGTGHELTNVSRYISTTIDGAFVWHLFERGTK